MAVSVALLLSAAVAGAQSAKDLPGRQVKVAAIAIGFGGDHDQKLKLAIEHLETAGEHGVDIACLPEEFSGEKAEPVPGPTTNAVGELAKKHHMWVICPIREQARDEEYNTAVLIDRDGKVAGYYRKVYVFWSENVHAGREGVKVFDTDFGRISLLTCFDANFSELWSEADAKGAEIVFWPSAYGGGTPLNGYAMIYGYYVVPVGWGNIIDSTGVNLDPVEKPRENQFIATIDLDRTFVHKDYTADKIARLLKEHAGEVELERDCKMEGWNLLRSVKPGVRVGDLCNQYQIETLQEYRHRSRAQITERRNAGKRIAADDKGNPL
jgi:hypothetical protein